MWLVGVVIRRYIDILIIIINIPYSTCIRSFFGRSILTSLFIFKCFLGLVRIRIRITEMAIFNFARRARKLRYYGDVIQPSYRKSAVEHDGSV